MLQKKVCVLGAFGVGKTTLIRRFVESSFSEVYLTIVGVKVDKKTLTVGTESLTLILWDVAGQDEVNAVRMSYVRGAAGYLLVADGTRTETLTVARSIHAGVVAEVGLIPFLLLLNKSDLHEAWDISKDPVDSLANEGWIVIRTSAKTGEGVEEAFQGLAKRLVS